jgi:hypothetical protein
LAWEWLDNATTYNQSLFSLSTPAPGADCVISQKSISFNLTITDCQSVNGTNLICQDIPRKKICPGLFRDASPTVCYLEAKPSVSTYDQALQQCNAIGGTLPSFHNESEWNDFLKQKLIVEAIQNYQTTESGIWIGLKDAVGDGTWVWEDGTNFDWNYWTMGFEPVLGHSCVVSDRTQADLAWKTVDCNGAINYAMICQMRLVMPPNSMLFF